MTTKQTLTDRIAATLKGKPSSDAVRAILAEAQDEADRLASERDKTRAASLDPTASADDVRKARASLSDIDFEAERLMVAAECLSQALEAAQAREASQAKAKAYEAARAERDALAKELATVYPEAAGKIADLLARIVKNNAAVTAVNRALPENAEWLADVEHVVRGVASNGNLTSGQPGQTTRLIDKVSLPHLVGDEAARDPHGLWTKGLYETGKHEKRPVLRAVS